MPEQGAGKGGHQERPGLPWGAINAVGAMLLLPLAAWALHSGAGGYVLWLAHSVGLPLMHAAASLSQLNERGLEWAADQGFLMFAVFLIFVEVPLLVGLCALLASPFLIWSARQPRFSLRKDEWVCTAWREEWITVPIVVGKVIIPQQRKVSVPVQWTRRGSGIGGVR